MKCKGEKWRVRYITWVVFFFFVCPLSTYMGDITRYMFGAESLLHPYNAILDIASYKQCSQEAVKSFTLEESRCIRIPVSG